MENAFRKANMDEHEAILQSEKKVMMGKLAYVIITFAVVLAASLVVNIRMSKNAINKEATDYNEQTMEGMVQEPGLEGFGETEETVIKSMYGDAAEYAENKVWENKKDFIDKDKTTETGEITYDEEAIEKYRQEMVAEFNAQIDHDAVAKELEARKAAYKETGSLSTQSASDSGSDSSDSQADDMLDIFMVENPVQDKNKAMNFTTILMGVLILGALVGTFVSSRNRYKQICSGDYEIADGRIESKDYQLRRDILFAKRKAVVNYQGGFERVILTYGQAWKLQVGSPVYLIHVNALRRPYFVCRK